MRQPLPGPACTAAALTSPAWPAAMHARRGWCVLEPDALEPLSASHPLLRTLDVANCTGLSQAGVLAFLHAVSSPPVPPSPAVVMHALLTPRVATLLAYESDLPPLLHALCHLHGAGAAGPGTQGRAAP